MKLNEKGTVPRDPNKCLGEGGGGGGGTNKNGT